MPEPAPVPRSERERIAALIAGPPGGRGVVLGPGDDAAVLTLGDAARDELVATTDTFVEGQHFRRELLEPAQVGARLAAANLSDLAAMAATPRWALVSLVVPPSWSAAECEALERGCAESLARAGAAIVGGNLASGTEQMVATLSLVGVVARGRAWTRGGGKPGDVLAVTGVPGSAAAALALALARTPPGWTGVPAELARAFVSPSSRVSLAAALAAAGGVHAAIDLSDGLAGDLARLCEASGLGAVLDEARLPASEPLRAAARTLAASALPTAGEAEALTRLRLGASDDYELLLAIDLARWADCERLAREAGAPLARIGELTAEPGRVLKPVAGAERPLDEPGWDHFLAGG